MLGKMDIDYVQSAIGYHFKNLGLLVQAFTRKSYSQEHKEVQNNEVLEFYGDEALDLYITKKMYKKFSKISDGVLVSEKNEGELTKLKSVYVSKHTLAQCSYNAGFYKFLFLGQSDIKNEAEKSVSVNEDLFESIIGAVAVDCDWDFKTIDKVCESMLNLDAMNDYLSVLVSEKCNVLGFGMPRYIPRLRQPLRAEDFRPDNWYEAQIGFNQFQSAPDHETGLYEYGIGIDSHFFAGSGIAPFQAKVDAESKALSFLLHEEIKRKIKKIDYSNAVSQLHEFAQKQIIMEPIYDFSEYHDSDGNPIWRCTVSLEGVPKKFSSDGISKKEVKQDAALQLLKFFIETEVEESEEWEPPVFYVGGAREWSDIQKAIIKEEDERLLKNLGEQ